MKKIELIEACTDLGVAVEGANLGPEAIVQAMGSSGKWTLCKIEKEEIMKDVAPENKRKNFDAVNHFNEALFHAVSHSLQEENFPIVLGGDHSLTIGSALASKVRWDALGLIWFDAHADFNTFVTTLTGNIHGLPFATVTGCNGNALTPFFTGNFFCPAKCVLIGARSIDYPGEYENLKKAGITIFTTEEVQRDGISSVVEKALAIVNQGTEGFHFSVDIDVVDPLEAPGVSVPAKEGLGKETFLKMLQALLQEKEKIKSMDIVEYNPLRDEEQKTLQILQEVMRLVF